MGRRIALYVLPLAVGQVLQAVSGFAALLTLGRMGTDSLAAAAVPIVLTTLATALFSPFASGSTILAARARRTGTMEGIHRVAGHGIFLALACGIGFGCLGAGLAPEILHAADVPVALLGIAVPYLRLVALSLPPLFVFVMYGALLHGLGDFKTPPAMLAAFTALFLAGLAVVHIGPLGVPVASLTAMLLVTASTAVALYVRRREFRFEVPLATLVPDARAIRSLLRLDLPVNAQCLAVALADFVLVGVANGYGARGVAAFAVVMPILAILTAPAATLANAVAVSERSLRGALLLTLATAGAMTIAAYVWAEPLLGAFLRDAQALAVAHTALITIAWSVLALGIGNLAAAELDACRQLTWPALAAIAGVWLVLVPCAIIFSGRWGIDGLWDAYPLAYASIAVVQIGIAPMLARRPRRLREQVAATPERTL